MTKPRAPRGRGAHRQRNAPLDFSEIVRRERKAKADAEMANATATTMRLDAVRLLPPVEQRLAELRRFAGVRVTVTPDFPDGLCTWCARGELATVRVIGQPLGDDLENPLKRAVVCHFCATSNRGPIHQARVEQDPTSRTPIEVEMCP